MKYLLDSNIGVNIMRRPKGAAAARFLATPSADMAISMSVKAELLVGPNRAAAHAGELAKVQNFLSRVQILDFDHQCAEQFGRIAARLFDKGSPVDGMDVQVAATAVRHGLIVVTRDIKDFGKIDGLTLENWITDMP